MFRIIAFAAFMAAGLFLLSQSVAAHPAWGIAVDSQGRVYVSSLENILRIDPQGRKSIFRQGVSGRHTHELTIDQTGNLYGEDLSYEPSSQRYTSAIWKMTPSGEFSYVLPPTTNPPKGSSIWRDRNGNTYLAQWNNNSDQEVFLLKRSPGGEVSTVMGSPKNGSEFRQVVLYGLGGMAFGPDGSLYLTDRSNVLRITLAGTVTTIARNLGESLSPPTTNVQAASLMGLTVDDSGSVYAADVANRRVLKISPSGAAAALLRSEESWTPTGVAWKNGVLYVLESGSRVENPRVIKLSSDGKTSVLAVVGNDENPPVAQPLLPDEPVIAAPQRFLPYALSGTFLSVFALVLVIWLVRRRKSMNPMG